MIKKQFTNTKEIKSEIINLSAVLNLPKGTEAYVSDIHGEYDKFAHIMKTGSGNIRRKISELFTGKLTTLNQDKLACLIYYPSEVLTQIKQEITDEDELEQWYMDSFNNLVQMLRYTANKYPHSLVQKSIGGQFLNMTEELLYSDPTSEDKQAYHRGLMDSVIDLKMADEFIISTCQSIQRLAIERIHIIGDVYDRGSHPEKVIEFLKNDPQNLDFQWGNHDILWLGSMVGSKMCMLNLLRICARYDNLNILKDAYDIDLTSLVKYARHTYLPLPQFDPQTSKQLSDDDKLTDNCIQQAAAIMQFKLEGQTIKRRPEFEMEDRLLLDKLSLDKQSITIGEQTYHIKNGCFQSVNPARPYQLTHSEQSVLIDLINQFTHSSKLNEDMWFMIDNGSMYLKHNGNLLMHGCVPVDENGNFLKFRMDGREYYGKGLCDYFEEILRDAAHHPTTGDCFNSDIVWYLWAGNKSPLFGKDRITTFERYFIDDPKLQEETWNPYYKFRQEASFADRILTEFGLNNDGHIINGHTPSNEDDTPVMADGKIIVIDGGLSKEHSSRTNIGGYTLLYDSYGLQLVSLKPFTTREKAIAEMSDVVSTKKTVDSFNERKTVADTDAGKKLKRKIADLSAQL